MRTSKLANFDAMQNAIAHNKVIVITHPKKEGRAEIIVKYPKDGAGRLQAWCADFFGPQGCDGVQYSSAGGYGYDKLTAALSNFTVDGHSLTDHCGQDEQSALFLRAYARSLSRQGADAADVIVRKARKAGYNLTNWQNGAGFTSCYREPGLDYLRALGYNVLTVG